MVPPSAGRAAAPTLHGASVPTSERLRLYREVFENSTDAIGIIGLDGRYLDQNPAHREMTGYSDAELRGLTPAVHLGEGTFAEIAESLKTTGRYRAEVVSRTKDGRELIVELSAFTVTDAHGAPLCFVGIKRDVTQRRAAEQALRDSQRNLQDFVETSAIGLHWVGPDGVILWANAADHEPLGYARDEFIGRHIAEFHADEDVIADILRRLQSGERLYDYPARLRCKDGSIRHVLIDSSVLWRDGKFIHTRCFTRDVTQQKQAEEQLRAVRAELSVAEKLSVLGTLVSGVAHEIRTPLTYIALNLALVQQELARAGVPAEARARIDALMAEASEGVDRVNLLVRDLRRFTRVPHHEQPRMALHEVVSQALELFAATHRGDARISASVVEVPPVRGDPVKIQQVILNLLQNAADALPVGGRISIATRHSDGHSEIVVGDAGPGVPADVAARMFEPFFTTKPEGTGLGLSIIRRIVEEHGGTIQHGTSPEGGAEFVVRLPLAASP